MTLFSRSFGVLGAMTLAATIALAPASANDASYAPPSSDAQALSLYKLGHEKKTSYAKKDAKFKVSHAEIFVNAPMKDVKTAAMDYGNYSSFITKFSKSKLLKQNGDAAEVFLQAPILHGAANIWAVESFAAPAPDGKGEKIVGSFIKGNVDNLLATWRYRPVDDKHTILSLDIYIEPKMNVPDSLVTEEGQDACGDGVRAVKERAEAQQKKLASAKP